MLSNNDKRLPAQPGQSPATRAIGWYMAKLQVAARHDPTLAGAFTQVANFLAPPSSLLRPAVVWHVLRGNLPATRRREPPVQVSQPAST